MEKFQEGAKGELDKKQAVIGEMLNPVKETLLKLDAGIGLMEKERKGEHEAFKEQIRALSDGEKLLKQETSKLLKALRTR